MAVFDGDRGRLRRAKRGRRCALRLRRLLGERLEPRTLLALTPQLVTDLNSGPAGIFVHGPIVEMGGYAYFSGGYGVNDYELWKSDGTTAGTVLVKDIYPGNAGSDPQELTNIGGVLYFNADDGTNGRELWTSNGTTAGTVMVKDITTGASSGHPQDFTNVNGTVFFNATSSGTGFELWKTNGTAAGTVLVKDILGGSASSDPSELTNFNGTLFFRAEGAFFDYQLWKSDGSSTGTVKVTSTAGDFRGLYPDNLTVVGANLFFTVEGSDGEELWKSNGTTTGEVALLDSGITGSRSYQLTNMNGILYFTPPLADGELWRSDGTGPGTFRVFDIYPGFRKSSPTFLTNIGGTLFFAANDGTHGVEPWISNGTGPGTVMLSDLAPGAASSSPGWFKFISGSVAFGADSTPGFGQLWQSPGPGLTLIVKDQIQAASQGIRYLTDIGSGRLIFTVDDGANGSELWLSTGSSPGITGKVVRDAVSNDGSGIGELIQIKNTLIFSGFDAAHGHELWRSDGTAAGTSVTDIIPGPGSSGPASLTNLNGTLLFSANDGTTGDELWSMNVGTGAATQVKDIFPGGVTTSSNPSNLTNVNGTVYFAANDGTHGIELWKTDGTGTGTTIVTDIVSGSSSSNPTMLTNLNGQLVFAVNDISNFSTGIQLWTSDGTPGGTQMLQSFSGSSFKRLLDFTVMGNSLYFFFEDSLGNSTLWKSNGTSGGTVAVRAVGPGSLVTATHWLTNVNGTLYFAANDGTHGTELWRSDGTFGGTFQVKDIFSGSLSASPSQLTNVNGTLFFTANDGSTGVELWKSDGTSTGTVEVKNISTVGSGPSELTNIRGVLLFGADGGNGRELWRSDGTVGGTFQLFDIAAGPASSSPLNIFSFGRQLLFTADDQAHGNELWSASEINAPPTGIGSTVLFPEDSTAALGTFEFGFYDPGNTIPDNLLAVQILTPPTTGILKDNGSDVAPNQFIPVADLVAGKLIYKPPPDANGNNLATLTFKVQDDGGTAGGGSDTSLQSGTITFWVYSVNDPPSGADGAITVLDHVPYKFSFDEFGFSDVHDSPPNSFLSVKVTSVTGNGSLTLNGSAVSPGQFVPKSGSNLVFTPAAADFNSQANYATITFQVKDDGGTASFGSSDLDPTPHTLTLNLLGTNTAPTGTDKAVTIPEDTSYPFSAGDFGFYDPWDSPPNLFKAVKITTLPSGGTLKLGGNSISAGDVVQANNLGALVFSPAANANGNSYTTFTFQVQDDGGTLNSGSDLDPTPNTVTISVTPVNDPPVSADVTRTINEDSTYTFNVVDFPFSDLNDANPPSSLVPNTFSSLIINTLPSNGSLVDGTTVINSAPLAVPISDISGGKLKFQPDADRNSGQLDSPVFGFTFKVQDSGGTLNGGDTSGAYSFSFNVRSVNDPPQGANGAAGAAIVTLEDTPLVFAADYFGFMDPYDTPSDALMAVVIVVGPANGSLKLNGSTIGAGTTVLVSDINLGRLTYVPAANANGQNYDSFTFKVQDSGGTLNGGSDTDPVARMMSIDVTPVPDAPQGANKTIAIPEDTTYTFYSIAGQINLPNDSDFGFLDPFDQIPPSSVSPDHLLNIIFDSVTNGSIWDSGSPLSLPATVPVSDLISGNLQFRPVANKNSFGGATFTVAFQLQDSGNPNIAGGQTTSSPKILSFVVNPVNDAPAGADFARTINENQSGTTATSSYTFSASDFGYIDSSDSATSGGSPVHIGGDSFKNVLITSTPSGSQLLDGGAALSGTAVNPAVVPVSHINVGQLRFVPTAYLNSARPSAPIFGFTFRLQDDGGTATTVGSGSPNAAVLSSTGVDRGLTDRTASFTVDSVNSPPQGANVSASLLEDASYTLQSTDFSFADNNDDPPNTLISIVITSLPVGGVLRLDGADITVGEAISPDAIAGGHVTFAPLPNANGNITFTFQVQDDGGTALGGSDLDPTPNTFTLQVTPVNDLPSFVKGEDKNTSDESGPLSFTAWATAISTGAANEASQKLQFVVQTNSNSSLFVAGPAIDSSGKLTFTPAPNVSGAALITIVLMDDGGTADGGVDTSDSQSFTINISKEHVWHNAANRLDVNGDTHVAANDALEVINFINAFGTPTVPTDGRPTGPYRDVNGDGNIAPNDALDVINAINAGQGGEGEQKPAVSGQPSAAGVDDLLAMLAADVATQTNGSRTKRA